MSSMAATPGSSKVLPASISTEQAGKLGKLLRDRGVRIATLGPALGLAEVMADAAELPPAFNAEDLAQVMGKVPV